MKNPIMKMAQYGGAVFSRFCPKCGKEAKPDSKLSVNAFMNQFLRKEAHSVGGKCKDCGFIRLPFLGWETDLI